MPASIPHSGEIPCERQHKWTSFDATPSNAAGTEQIKGADVCTRRPGKHTLSPHVQECIHSTSRFCVVMCARGRHLGAHFQPSAKSTGKVRKVGGVGWNGMGEVSKREESISISLYKSVPTLSPHCPHFVPVLSPRLYSLQTRMDTGFPWFVPTVPTFLPISSRCAGSTPWKTA